MRRIIEVITNIKSKSVIAITTVAFVLSFSLMSFATIGSASANPAHDTDEVISPAQKQVVNSDTLNLNAIFKNTNPVNPDNGLRWKVKQGACSGGTSDTLIYGNVDGKSNSYHWDGRNFSANVNVGDLTPGKYCFVFNPYDFVSQDNVRTLVDFSITHGEQ
jgi:hypothetical protein